MHRLMGLSSTLLATAVIATLPNAACAQQTFATARGVVIDAAGKPVAGATVTITDTRSGRVDVARTNRKGFFTQTNLAIGGPYKIRATDGDRSAELTDVRLDPGPSDTLRIALKGAQVADIIVTGERTGTDRLNNAVGSAFSRRDVANQPNISRDIVSVVSRDPLVTTQCEARDGLGSFCIAGANPRFSGFTIDGSPVRNDLALGFNTSPTTRSPISLDAIESVTVKASDYSVLASGFLGGLVSVTTRSGTNDFHGSAYLYRSSDGLSGDKAFGRTIAIPKFSEKEYGGTLGGPIIKDKLFFFGGYERLESQTPVSFRAADQAAGRDPAIFQRITDLFKQAYNIDLGGRPETAANELKSERIFAKLDANINSANRLTVSFNRAHENDLTFSPTVFTNAAPRNDRYLTTVSGELYSKLSDSVSTQLRFTYKGQRNTASCNGPTAFPSITFSLNPSTLAGDPLAGLTTQSQFFNAGCQNFVSANHYNDDRFIGEGRATIVSGDHTVLTGASFENYFVNNAFVQRAYGEYSFSTGARILGRSPNSINYSNAITNNVDDATTRFGYGRLALYAQDTWQISPTLEVDLGLRYEYLAQQRRPARPAALIAAFPGLNLNATLNGKDILLPRASFIWNPGPNTRISAGAGLFAGGDPVVWLSNAFQPPLFNASLPGQPVTDITQLPAGLTSTVALGGVPARVALIDPNYKIPYDIKGSLRLEQRVGGFRFLGQALYSYSRFGFGFRDVDQLNVERIGVAPDGRPIYANHAATGQPDLIQLFNTEGGRAWALTASVSRRFKFGADFQLSYAFQDVTSINAGTSSTATASRESTVDADQNRPSIGRSPFEIKHNVTFNLGYEHRFVRNLLTRLDFFSYWSSGSPVSYVYQLSPSGNGAADNSLFGRPILDFPINSRPIYVPNVVNGAFSDPRVVFAPSFDQSGFLNFISQRGLQPGAIVKRNSDTSRSNKRVDLRFQQELPFLSVGPIHSRVKFVVDIQNFLGILKSSWGEQYTYPSFYQAPTIRADIVSAADVAANGVTAAKALLGNSPATVCATSAACVYRYNSFLNPAKSLPDDINSVYQIRLGIRLEF